MKRYGFVRLLTYILVGAGAAIAVIALAVVLLDDGEQQTVAPQAEGGQPAIVVAEPKATNGASDDAASASNDSASNGSANNGGGGDKTGAPDTTANAAAGDSGADETMRMSGAAAPDAAAAVIIDLAQVRPDGNAVFAGKAPPNAVVTVFEGEVVLGTTTADASGEWVIVPDKALGVGEHLVSVGAKTADGETDIADETLAIMVGETVAEQPLVALLPQTETEIPQLLQSPDDTPQTAQQVVVADTSGNAAETVTVGDPEIPVAGPAIAPRSLSWQDDGSLTISGVSRGGVSVRVEAGAAAFGGADVGADGAWQVAGRVDIDRAQRIMRFALADDAGKTVATYELPVATRDLSQGMDGSRLVIVQQGDALWRIAYRSYGEGIKYVDIVRRNAAAINDPDLIFPNQIFAIPK